MRNISSPHGGLLHHRHHLHEGALREHDSHLYDDTEGHHRRHRRGPRGRGRSGHGHVHVQEHERHHLHEYGHEHHHGRRHHHDHGHHHGRGRNPFAARASDPEVGSQVVQVEQQIRAATRSLLHHGTPQQLAEAQGLLAENRRALYLILADDAQAATGEQAADIGEPASPSQDDAAETTAPPEVG